MPKISDPGDTLGDVAECGFQAPTAEMGITAEAAGSLNLKAEIKLQIPLEPGTLGIGEDSQDDLSAFATIKDAVRAGDDVTPDTHCWRKSATEVDIGGSGLYRITQQINDVWEIGCWIAHEVKELEMPLRRRRNSAGFGQAWYAISGSIA